MRALYKGIKDGRQGRRMNKWGVYEAREIYLSEKDPKEKARLKRIWRAMKRKFYEERVEGGKK